MSAAPNPAKYVVGKFGGINATARALSTEDKPFAVSTVQGWVERAKIPQEHWGALLQIANERGVELTVADFLPPGVIAA